MNRILRNQLALLAFFAGAGLSAAYGQNYDVPKGLPPLKAPADNPLTSEKIALGKQLYFDPRLSRDNTVSCASCHDPRKGWSNGDQFATGVGGKKGGRNAPTVLNSAYFPLQFWDGRADHLEGQALGPIQNPIEMNLPIEEAIARINGIEGYRSQFLKIFGAPATSENLAKVLACYERTVLSGDAPYDRFKAGDKNALSEAAQRGMKVFFHQANCSACHSGPNFSDGAFHNIGVGMAAAEPDVGRMAVTKIEGDRGSFKTPTLREIGRTAPYMHDGSMKNLEEVIAWYDKGGHPNPQLDEEIFPLKLSATQKADLIVFLLEGLASDSYPEHSPPELPR